MPRSALAQNGNWLTRFAIAPAPVFDEHPVVAPIVDGIELLAARQQSDGSWGRGSALDKLITTCHSTMALVAGGFSISEKELDRARQWLCSPTTAQHNNSYWILGPLSAWFGTNEDANGAVRHEIEKLRVAIENEAQPHPDQYIQYFYLRIVEALPELREESAVLRYTETLRGKWSRDYGWARRPDTTTVCYAVLQTFDEAFAASIRHDVIRLLDTWAAHPEPQYTVWRNPISTAYTIMNLVESGLIHDANVKKQADEAIAWLIAVRGADGLWSSDSPYGGTGDIKSREYPTAAVLRSLIAYASAYMPSAQASISAARLLRYRAKLKQRRRWIAALGAVTSALLMLEFGSAVWHAASSLVQVETLGIILAVVGIVLTVVAWLFPDAREKALVWFKRNA